MPAMPYKWKALLTVAMGTMMATMDASITTIAFPELTRVFQTDLATVMWIAVAYILVSSSLMLIFGKISDFIGRSRIYTVGMAHIKSHGLMAPVVLLFVGAGFVILFLFILVERRATDPIIDPALFKNRTFSYATGGLLLFFLAVPPYILIMPFYLMEGINLSPLESGMLLAVVSMVTMVTSPISGALSDRFGPVWPSVFGAGATAAAFFFMLGFDLQTEISTIILILILLGLGVGVFQPPNNSTIMGAVERKRLGSASALIATERQVGISLGMALAGAIFSTRQTMYQDLLRLEGWNAARLSGGASHIRIPGPWRHGFCTVVCR